MENMATRIKIKIVPVSAISFHGIYPEHQQTHTNMFLQQQRAVAGTAEKQQKQLKTTSMPINSRTAKQTGRAWQGTASQQLTRMSKIYVHEHGKSFRNNADWGKKKKKQAGQYTTYYFKI